MPLTTEFCDWGFVRTIGDGYLYLWETSELDAYAMCRRGERRVVFDMRDNRQRTDPMFSMNGTWCDDRTYDAVGSEGQMELPLT